jgi:hypothetical protein
MADAGCGVVTELGIPRNDASNPLADLASVREWALDYIARQPEPDFHIGPKDNHQLQRWFVLPRNPFANVYLHRFLRSDDDRALHDHPWDNRSWVLSGVYIEHLQDGSTAARFEGDVVERTAIEAHRVELVTGPAVTLFFTGPIIRSWGFYCPKGWVPWRLFVDTEEGGNRRGQGCGE